MAESTNYVIKKVSSVAEYRATFMSFGVSEGWMPAIDEAEIFYNTDPEGFFVGELDGKPISCVSLVRYGESFAFVGMYIVLKEHRGKGYGLTLWKRALEFFPSTYNVALDAGIGKVSLYQKWGFKEAFKCRKVQIDIGASFAKLVNYSATSDCTIQSARLVNFDKLSAYDNAAFGAPHQKFLKGLLEGPNTITLVATDTADEVVGFVAACKMVIEKRGWRLAPLYADSDQIARAILKEVLQQMRKNSPEREVAMLELAPEGYPLAEELNATTLTEIQRMFTKGQLDFARKKVYSFNSADLG